MNYYGNKNEIIFDWKTAQLKYCLDTRKISSIRIIKSVDKMNIKIIKDFF